MRLYLGRKFYLELALPQRLTRNSELRKNAKRIATKTPNKTPQKHQTKCHKKHQTPCRIHKEPVSLQHHYIANNMEYLKRTADEHLSLLREPDLLMVIKGGEMAHSSGWYQNHSAGLLEGLTCDAVNPQLIYPYLHLI